MKKRCFLTFIAVFIESEFGAKKSETCTETVVRFEGHREADVISVAVTIATKR